MTSGEGVPEEPMVKHPSIPEPPVVKRHSLREEPSFRRQRLSLAVPDEVPMSARTARRRSTGVGVRPRGAADAGGGGGGPKVGSWNVTMLELMCKMHLADTQTRMILFHTILYTGQSGAHTHRRTKDVPYFPSIPNGAVDYQHVVVRKINVYYVVYYI